MTYVKLLYGSRARGQADEWSDTDMLCVSDASEAEYTWSDLLTLREYGSLFLWHLHLEARVISADTSGRAQWEALTRDMPAYSRADRDLVAFELVLADVAESLQTGDSDIKFEGAVVARTVRHAAILACYLSGAPNFSRYDCVSLASNAFGSPTPDLPFERLYDCILRDEQTANERAVSDWVKWGFALVAAIRDRQTVMEVA